MSERITEDEERRIREAYEAADSAEGHAPHWWYVRALFGEIEAVRAERDEAEGAALVHAEDAGMYRARAEAAEAKLDEQIEAAIALRHDLDTLRDLYGAAEARIARVEAIDWAAEINWSDGSAHYLDAERAVRAALAEPACGNCGDTKRVPRKGRPSPEPTRPCPSCTPPDPKETQP